MVITLDDMGHPLEPGYNHWVAWNIKPADCISGIFFKRLNSEENTSVNINNMKNGED